MQQPAYADMDAGNGDVNPLTAVDQTPLKPTIPPDPMFMISVSGPGILHPSGSYRADASTSVSPALVVKRLAAQHAACATVDALIACERSRRGTGSATALIL